MAATQCGSLPGAIMPSAVETCRASQLRLKCITDDSPAVGGAVGAAVGAVVGMAVGMGRSAGGL